MQNYNQTFKQEAEELIEATRSRIARFADRGKTAPEFHAKKYQEMENAFAAGDYELVGDLNLCRDEEEIENIKNGKGY